MIDQAAEVKLLDVRGVKKFFPISKGFLSRARGYVRAVDDISFYVRKGETLGLVGESGSGKTTLGKCIIQAFAPTAGVIDFRLPDGTVVDLADMSRKAIRHIRRHMHMIFQDPYASLNPRMTVLDIVAEPLVCNNISRGSELRDRVRHLLEVVGLEVKHMSRYPHAFSGGQRQRIGIARSLAANPELIICDEAVSALDVSVQAQVLNLLQELQEKFNLTYLFIAHDLAVVEHIADRVAVMYVGRMMELADTADLYSSPKHPYTEALMSAVPKADPEHKMERIILEGDVANPAKPPSGCYFHPRCRYAREICREETPGWEEVAPRHFCACHRVRDLALKGVE